MIAVQRLHQLFEYDQGSGSLIRLIAISRSSRVGEEAGFIGKNGYLYASVDGKTYPLHRLIWAWHGNDAVTTLDHIDRDNSNNRIENLRPATRAQNMQNRGIQKNNTTGVKGVIWKKDKKKFRVRISVNGRRIHIGDFAHLELAELAATEARAKYHGQFATH
jgi:hypothetical protein